MRCSSAKRCKNGSNKGIIHQECFTKFLQTFLFIRNLANHSKTNSMRFMNLTMVYDFLQVIRINRGLRTKDDYFLSRNNLLLFIYYKIRIKA
jgi:hypothetical protein